MLFACFTPAFADCDHCFGMYQVRFVYKTGRERTVYMPIYGGDVSTTFWENGRKTGKDILPLFKNESRSIYHIYSKKVYDFNAIGSVFCKEELDSIKLSSLRQLIFMKTYEKIQGAGSVPSLSKQDINRIFTGRIIGVGSIEGSCCETRYICLDTTLSGRDFHFLLKYEPFTINDNICNIVLKAIDNIVLAMRRNEEPWINPQSDKLLKDVLIQIKNDIDSISGDRQNASVASYFVSVEELLLKTKRFVECVYTYTEKRDTSLLFTFIDNEVTDDEKRDNMSFRIRRTYNKSVLFSVFCDEMINYLKYIERDDKLRVFFDNVVKETKMINYEICWD